MAHLFWGGEQLTCDRDPRTGARGVGLHAPASRAVSPLDFLALCVIPSVRQGVSREPKAFYFYHEKFSNLRQGENNIINPSIPSPGSHHDQRNTCSGRGQRTAAVSRPLPACVTSDDGAQSLNPSELSSGIPCPSSILLISRPVLQRRVFSYYILNSINKKSWKFRFLF